MSQKQKRYGLVLLVLLLVLVTTATVFAADGMTPEQVAAAEREFTYTTAEDVEAGRVAAEEYWMRTHTLHAHVAAERELTYTTAEDVQKGKVAAEAYWEARETAASR